MKKTRKKLRKENFFVIIFLVSWSEIFRRKVIPNNKSLRAFSDFMSNIDNTVVITAGPSLSGHIFILPMFFRALRGCFFISRLSIFSLQFLIIWRSSGYFWGFQILSHFCWIFRSEFYNAIFLQNDFS